MTAANSSNQELIPRRQTLLPIIAAWALCGNERSPTRVSEWINQLTALSTLSLATPYLAPDVNTFAAKIIAVRRYQASVIAQCDSTHSASKDSNAKPQVEHVFGLAKNCCALLVNDLLSNKANFAGLIDAEACAPIFVNCIEAWGGASKLAKQLAVNEYPINTSQGVQEMTQIYRLFDSKLKEALEVENAERKCSKHMIECMDAIYTAVVLQLIQLDSTTRLSPYESESRSSMVGERIADMDRMLRNYEHYSRLLNVPSDAEMKAKRLGFYSNLLNGCKGVTDSSDYGYVIRMCTSIMSYLSYSKEHRTDEFIPGGNDITNIFAEIVSLSCKFVVHPIERKRVLTKVYNDARQFFDKSDKKRFGVVDEASLLGAIRLELKELGTDNEADIEAFLESLEKGYSKKRRNAF
jgi:hypothetical protein